MSGNRGQLIPTPPTVSPHARHRLARLREVQPLQSSGVGDECVMDLGMQCLPPSSAMFIQRFISSVFKNLTSLEQYARDL